MININDFAKVEMRVGLVTQAEDVEKSNKLIRLQVDFGEEEVRTIFTGVRTFGYTTDDFADKQFLFVTNLEPRKMMGEESQGMILAVDGQEDGRDKPFFITAAGLPLGAKVN
jgi:methionine--tRNA ligase beta chain